MTRRITVLVLIGFVLICVFFSTQNYGLENVDYAVSVKLNADGKYTFYIADLQDYKGSAEQLLETKEYVYPSSMSEENMNNISDDITSENISGKISIEEICEQYRSDTRRMLSVEHVRRIVIDGVDAVDEVEAGDDADSAYVMTGLESSQFIQDTLLELANYIDISDTVRVSLPEHYAEGLARDRDNTVGFRELVKEELVIEK